MLNAHLMDEVDGVDGLCRGMSPVKELKLIVVETLNA
jgi:hypothetical protein